MNLSDTAPTGRLVAGGGMCSHKIALADPTEVDTEVIAWLRTAYEQSGATSRG